VAEDETLGYLHLMLSPILKLQTDEGVVIRAEFKPQGGPAENGGVLDVDWVDFYFDADDGYLENWIVQPLLFKRSYHEFQDDGSIVFDIADEGPEGQPCLSRAETDRLLEWLTEMTSPPLIVTRAPRSRPSSLSA
jgi:hypothetical protein